MAAKVWAVFRKDLLIEVRTKDSLNAMLFFGIVVLVIFNFALESVRETIRAAVPGVLWVSFAFAGTLGSIGCTRRRRRTAASRGC